MSVFGSFTSRAPMWSFACHAANTAPAGSANTAMRPDSKMSNGGANTAPPAASTAVAVASTSSVARYVVHTDGMPSICNGPSAATSRPFSLNIV